MKTKTTTTTILLILCTLILGQLTVSFGSQPLFRKGYTPFYIDFFGGEKPQQYPVKHTTTLHKDDKSSPVESQKGLSVNVQVLNNDQSERPSYPKTGEPYLLRFYIVEVPVTMNEVEDKTIALHLYLNDGELVFQDEWPLSELLDGVLDQDKDKDKERQVVSDSKPEENFPYGGQMVLVKSGNFQMGDEYGDLFEDCQPRHPVQLTYDYYMGKTEVTFEAYDAYCRETGKEKPSADRLEYKEGEWVKGKDMGRGSRPVIHVSWYDAAAYCNWLSEKEGLAKAYDGKGNLLDTNGRPTRDITQVEGYRLPTEAEWEYAARGGHKSTQDYPFAGHTDMGYVGWYAYNSGEKEYAGLWEPAFVEELDMKTHEVGQKMPNELGLYDMSGNVWEWCHDGYGRYTFETRFNPIGLENASTKVLRGGSWYSYAEYCRVANRNHSPRDNKSFGIGFRVVRTGH